jgi:hypothetical protein
VSIEEPTSFGTGYKSEVEHIILGKHLPLMQTRSTSEVSVQPSNE